MSFCANCGTSLGRAPIDHVYDDVPTEKKNPLVKFALIALCAVAMLVGGIFALKALTSGRGSGNYRYASDSLCWREGNNCGYIYDKKNNMLRVSNADKMFPIGDNSTALIFGDENIYFYENEEATFLNENGLFWAISSTGNAAVYGVESGYEEDFYDLYLYRDGKSKLICQDKRIGGAILSPDGKKVVYSIVNDDWDPVATYLWDGKNQERNDLENALTITNDGKLAYVASSDIDAIYAVTKKGRTFVGDCSSFYSGDIYFNDDNTEVIFQNKNSTYYSADGKKATEISSKACEPMFPPNAYAVKHFKGTFFVANSSSDNERIFYLDKNLEMQDVASGVDGCMLANDGKTIVYLRDGGLYRVNGTKKNAKAKELVSNGVSCFSPTDNGKSVYYANNHGDLLYVTGSGKSTYLHALDEFSSGWYSGYAPWKIYDGDKFVFTYADAVFLADGKKIRELPSFNLKNINVSCDKYVICISGEDKYSGDWISYRSIDGKNFIRLEGE